MRRAKCKAECLFFLPKIINASMNKKNNESHHWFFLIVANLDMVFVIEISVKR